MSTPTKAAEIRELAEKIWLNATSHGINEPIASQAKAIIALLADMEREGGPVKVVTTIKGWVRPAGVDVHGPGYELGSGCGWCEFNEVGQPDHGDQPATLIIGTHPSPTAADAKDSRSKPQPSVEEVMEVVMQWLWERYSKTVELRDRLTKLFNP